MSFVHFLHYAVGFFSHKISRNQIIPPCSETRSRLSGMAKGPSSFSGPQWVASPFHDCVLIQDVTSPELVSGPDSGGWCDDWREVAFLWFGTHGIRDLSKWLGLTQVQLTF